MSENKKSVQITTNIILTLVIILMLIPFILLIVASFTDGDEITLRGYTFFPQKWSLSAYSYIWTERSQIFHAYFITIIVTAIGTTASLLITMLYGYVLSKPFFPGKKFFAFFVLFTMLFNGGLVPTYTWYTRYLGIKNTLGALIIPSLLMSAMNVILVRSYIQNNIPLALTEAAFIDGANEYQIFARVVFPLCKPIAVTIGMFIGVGYWNDWTNGLYYVTKSELFSIQQLLTNMIKNIEYLSSNSMAAAMTSAAANVPRATVRMAIAVVGILPILIIFPYIQKFFVKGISLGAVKG